MKLSGGSNPRPLEQQTTNQKRNMIPKLLVLINPHEKGELAPLVRFEPVNGFSVRHGNIKGAWRDNITNAVEDYNGSVERALKRLRLVSFVPETFDLGNCFGVHSAFEGFRIAQGPPPDAPKPPPSWPEGATPGCGCGACQRIKEDAAKEEASRLHPPKRKPGGGLSPLLALLAMSGVLGSFLEDEDADDFTRDVENVDPELADHLAKVGLLFMTGGGLGRAIVAIPRRMGEAFVSELEDAIRNNDLERVKRLTAGKKFN